MWFSATPALPIPLAELRFGKRRIGMATVSVRYIVHDVDQAIAF